ncbi:lysophospholipid acyltransferase family protein [Marinibaculum pumilum]|uniref:Lysophospholipid acyltransferase family protein n=1 Tax=Marinibaculum pumilum TaxID=1766165 RepID=A0ABV7KVL9_9PROT
MGRIIAAYIRLVHLTIRWRRVGWAEVAPLVDGGGPVIAAAWHGRLLMMPMLWPMRPVWHSLISQHRDGTIIARAAASFGVQPVRGSSHRPGRQSKGGGQAFRRMLAVLRDGGRIGITPDGPRGPRMRAQMGTILLARMSGAPILPCAYATGRCKVLRSWDRFILPLPFCRGTVIWGRPMTVPNDADPARLEALRRELEAELNRIAADADRACGHEPIAPAPPAMAGDAHP